MARRTISGGLLTLATAAALLGGGSGEASAGHAAWGHGAFAHAASARHQQVRFAVRRSYAGLQCVPFARDVSGIEIGGNAWTWWDQAEGVYERGARPEPGSVLSFTANGRMRLGHVAVVTDVVNAREIAIDHANWSGHGGINREMRVMDVSDSNDWTAVRVELANGDYGSIYPTHGFIYDRPDRGSMVANAERAPAPDLGPAPEDLRRLARYDEGDQEVAEAPEHLRHAHRGAAAHRRYGRASLG